MHRNLTLPNAGNVFLRSTSRLKAAAVGGEHSGAAERRRPLPPEAGEILPAILSRVKIHPLIHIPTG